MTSLTTSIFDLLFALLTQVILGFVTTFISSLFGAGV